jgi:predicted nuclease of predicted toxin-antitoxin system
MNLADCKFLLDENIPHAVFEFLKGHNRDVVELASVLPKGTSDSLIMDEALKNGRIVITQDVGFGKSQFTGTIKKVGIIYIYPGHVGAANIIEMLTHLFTQSLKIELPFIIVAHKKDGHLKIRTRNLFYQ